MCTAGFSHAVVSITSSVAFYVSEAKSNSASPPWLRPFGANPMEENQERIRAGVRGTGAKLPRSGEQTQRKKNGIITPNLFDINLNYWPDEPSVNP